MKVAATRDVTPSKAVDGEAKQYTLVHLKAFAQGIVETFGPCCEVVIHDFTDLEHSIVWIEGNVTNRRIGGSITDFGLTRIQVGEMANAFNYTTHTADGRTLKSSTVFLADGDGELIGAICLNIDISAFQAAEQILKSFNFRDNSHEIVETFGDDVQGLLDSMVSQAEREVGKPINLMNKLERVAFVARLETKGTFRLKRAVTLIAERMNVSRFTIYNYLNEAHANADAAQ